MPNATPTEIFISYAHEDEVLCNELIKHLAGLKRSGVIAAWHDRKIKLGSEWKGILDERLKSSRVILLLVSPDFVNSDYCYDIEMKQALELHASGKSHVIPVVLRPVDWSDTPFAKLQGLPKDCKPVTSWDSQDEAFLDIANGIKNLLHHTGDKTSQQSNTVSNAQCSPVDFGKLEQLLSQDDWIEGDEESRRLLKQIFENTTAISPYNQFQLFQDRLQVQTRDLQTLNKIWFKKSRGHFGLSSQRKVWLTVPRYENECDDWKRAAEFGIRVGWLQETELNREFSFWETLGSLGNSHQSRLHWRSLPDIWERLSGVNEITELPKGFLPFLVPLSIDSYNELTKSLWIRPWTDWCLDYFMRLKECDL